MARITYEQAYADHSYLWTTYGPAHDMTGGYVDQDDLAKLLASPSKATARKLLCRQIDYWFEVGPDISTNSVDLNDPILREIYERYEIEWNTIGL